MDGKVKHRPTTFMGTQELKRLFWSPNLSCNPDTVKCSAHILSSRSPNDLILFLLESWDNFLEASWEFYSNYDVNNGVLLRQEDKDCHQVKMWPPTHQLVKKSNSSKFWPIKGGIYHVLRHLGFQIKIMLLLSLLVLLMFCFH